MAKNSIALFFYAIITKGSGFIVAVLVARYLGPAALGTYAAVMGLSMLLESIAPLGQPFVIIRQVARDRARLVSFWFNTSLATFVVSLLLSVVIVVVLHQFVNDQEYLTSAYIVAFFLPIAGLYGIAMAFVQGLEQMEAMAIAAFIGRVFGLLLMWLLLRAGLRVSAAFIGYGVFQLAALLALYWVILRKTGLIILFREARLDLAQGWSTLRISFPFAIQTLLKGALDQLSVLILPLMVSMAVVGMFDAADRIRQTSVMLIPIITLSIFPTLSRTILTERPSAVTLMERASKLLHVMVLPFVFFTAIAADQIIPLFYGPGYEAAVPVLRVVVWAQVFLVFDAVLVQMLMASNHESLMVRNTALTLGANIVLLVALAPLYGAIGAAWAVVVTYIISLVLDARFVFKHITPLNLVSPITRPLLCAVLSGGVALVTHQYGLWVSFACFVSSYGILLLVFRIFTVSERLLARQMVVQLWHRLFSPHEHQINKIQ